MPQYVHGIPSTFTISDTTPEAQESQAAFWDQLCQMSFFVEEEKCERQVRLVEFEGELVWRIALVTTKCPLPLPEGMYYWEIFVGCTEPITLQDLQASTNKVPLSNTQDQVHMTPEAVALWTRLHFEQQNHMREEVREESEPLSHSDSPEG